MSVFGFLLAAIIGSACAPGQDEQNEIAGSRYNFDDPDRIIVLSGELREISGLTMYNAHFLAVQDERGDLFTVNYVSGTLDAREKFWKNGDFEGIEHVENVAYALKSNGNLYRIRLPHPDRETTEKLDVDLPKNDNFEGLGYDPEIKSLIVAAKKKRGSKKKEIYAVRIGTEGEDPVVMYTVEQKAFRDTLTSGKKGWWQQFASNVSMANYSFNPSAVAVHPQSHEKYILSSPIPQVLILSREWQLKSLILLDPLKFRQPESLCFDREGNLFIGNEGKGGMATILKFEQQ